MYSLRLVYLRNRYYDPHMRRFISEDPIGLAGGINPYVYAGNDPVNRTDRFGLDEDDRPDDIDIGPHGLPPVCVEIKVEGASGGGGFFFPPRGIPFSGFGPGSSGGGFGGGGGGAFGPGPGPEAPAPPRSLNECEKNTLTPYIPQPDLDAALLHLGKTPWYLPSRYRAITRGNDIYFRAGAYNPATASGPALLGHELVHVGQYRRGATAGHFFGSYAIWTYDNSPFEISVHRTQQRILGDLSRPGFSGCRG